MAGFHEVAIPVEDDPAVLAPAPPPAPDSEPTAPPATGFHAVSVPAANVEVLQSEDIDTETGAPMKIRFFASLASNEKDELAEIRKVFPDAYRRTLGGPRSLKQSAGIPQPHPATEKVILFKNPETNDRLTVFNPRGFEIGSIGEAGPPVVRGAAALAGMVVGAGGGIPGMALGAAGASKAADLAMRKGFDITDTRGGWERFWTDLADMGLEAVGGLVGAKGGVGRSTAVKGAATRRVNQARKEYFDPEGYDRPDIARDLRDLEVSPEGMGQMVSDSATVRARYEAILTHPEGGPVQKAVNNSYDDLVRAADKELGAIGPYISKAEAGESIQRGLRDTAENATMKQNALENHLEEVVGRKTVVEARTTAANLSEKIADAGQGPIAPTPELGKSAVPSKYQEILSEIQANDGKLFFQQLRNYRQQIGAKLDHPTEGPFNKQLYGWLSDDMARGAGLTPQGAKAYTATQTHWAAELKRRKSLRTIMDSGEPESAFTLALTGATKGHTKLKRLKDSLSERDWNDVVNAQMREMAMGKPGKGRGGIDLEFSADTFATNWRRMPKESRDVLLPPFSKLRKAWDKLARVSEQWKQAKMKTNWPRTAPAITFLGQVGGLSQKIAASFNPITLATGFSGVVKNVMIRYGLRKVRSGITGFGESSGAIEARLMASADFVNWLSNGQKVDMAKPGAVAKHFGLLLGVTAADPSIREDVIAYIAMWPANTAAGAGPPESFNPATEALEFPGA